MKEVSILFIDDEESIVDGVRRLFMRESYGIVATTEIEEAREILATQKIKVVVSDQRMPQIAGVKFLQEVKDKYPHVVKVLFTGYTDFTAAQEAINMGEVYRFISKPWKTSELITTVRQCLEHYDLVAAAKAHEENLEEANKKLRAMYEVQKEFTSTVSHELRTPLASIKAAIDLVVKRMLGEINREQEDVLGRAKSNVDRLKRLIDDILDLTKIENGKAQMNIITQDLHRVILDVVETQKDVAQSRGLFVKAELNSQVSRLPFDNDRIVQVMGNLLSNALKFTKSGGVTVSTRENIEENNVVVSVRDTGKGISEADLPKLFQKFQQVESSQENEEGGTGLGLAICKEIITRHQGRIWVESKVGEGTVFSFLLPMQERRMQS